MRVDKIVLTQYIFTEEEVEHLLEIGVWDLILTRLTEHERVEIVSS